MANKDGASERLAEVTARINARFMINPQPAFWVATAENDTFLAATAENDIARLVRMSGRYTINLRRAFLHLVAKLKRAYGQPARAAARSQDVAALLAVADFLDQMGGRAIESDLAHFADQFARQAQALRDAQQQLEDTQAEMATRSYPTLVWMPRTYVVLAVEALRQRSGSRKSKSRGNAAKWAVERHPELKQLGSEKAIISWCEEFAGRNVKNPYAVDAYSVGIARLKAWAPNCNNDQIEEEAERLLQQGLRLAGLI